MTTVARHGASRFALGDRSLLGVDGGWALACFAGFMAVNTVLAVCSGAVLRPWLYAPAIGVMALVLGSQVLARGDRLPIWVVAMVVVGSPVMLWLGCLAVREDNPGMAYYFITQAVSVIFALACMRQRPVPAFLQFVLCTGVVVLAGDRGWMTNQVLTRGYVNGVAISVIGLVLAATVGVTTRRIEDLRRRALAEASTSAAASAAGAERDERLSRLDEQARGLLSRIAGGNRMSDDERLQCGLVAARLRDEIRAPALDVEAIAAAVVDARTRGVTVRLLDDSGSGRASAVRIEGLVAAAVGELSTASPAATVAIRVHPPERPVVATITVSAGPLTSTVAFDRDSFADRVMS